MKTLTLRMLDGLRETAVAGITSFVANDATGQFGLLPGCEALLTALEPGLFRYRQAGGDWQFVACAGGVLYCRDDHIAVISARFLSDDDPQRLAELLRAQRAAEHEQRVASTQSTAELDRTLMKRLRQLSEERAR